MSKNELAAIARKHDELADAIAEAEGILDRWLTIEELRSIGSHFGG